MSMQNKMHVRKDDLVAVISGKDKGKKGKVLVSEPKDGRIIVEGVNIVTKHKKARAQGQPGGIIHQEAPIDASNVMLYCDKCKKTTRRSIKILDDGSRVRVCRHCGETFDR